MAKHDLFEEADILRRDLDPDCLGILEDLYRRLDAHWEHKPVSQDPEAPVPKWALVSCTWIQKVKAGTFGKDTKLPVDWLEAHAPNPLTHHPFASWEGARGCVLHAADAMLADPSYRVGSHFFPTSMPDWFLSTPARKARWSCFLRYANKPLILGDLDLAALGTYDSTVQRIRSAMSLEAVEAVEKALRARGAKGAYDSTAWTTAGKLYAWFTGEERALARLQFGQQLDRSEGIRHTTKFDLVCGDFGRLVQHVRQWVSIDGVWRGWFPRPGESGEWERFCDWCASEHGVYLRVLASRPAGMSRKQEPAEWEKTFLL